MGILRDTREHMNMVTLRDTVAQGCVEQSETQSSVVEP